MIKKGVSILVSFFLTIILILILLPKEVRGENKSQSQHYFVEGRGSNLINKREIYESQPTPKIIYEESYAQKTPFPRATEVITIINYESDLYPEIEDIDFSEQNNSDAPLSDCSSVPN